MEYDPNNITAIMVHICDTQGFTHPQMMTLWARVKQIFDGQPLAFSKRTAPVTLNGVAIALGLAISFGGYEAALKLSDHQLLKRAREVDPYAQTAAETRRAMQRRARQFMKGVR